MKLFRLPLILFVIILISGNRSQAQDLHFTLQQLTPVAFNPANTGGFLGSYRLSGLYRDQYRSVAGKGAYSTPTFSIDAPILKGFGKNDWVGVGVMFFTDKSGTGGLVQSSFKISAAYHLGIGKAGRTTLAIAYQTGAIQRFIKNSGSLVFEDGLLSGMESQELAQVIDKENKKGFLDHVGGLKLTTKTSKTTELSFGFAAGKFGRPDWSLLMAGGNYRVNPRMYAQVGLNTLLADKLRFLPNISYQKIFAVPFSTLQVQGVFDYLYNTDKNIILSGGLGWRSGAGIGDAFQVMLGGMMKDVRVMLAYDLNVSPLSGASRGAGAFELGVQYIGKIYKRPKPDPVIFCPRF